MQHLVFYDGNCGLCDHTVQALLKVDTKEIFAFAPLQGSTAERLLKDLPDAMKQADSLVLVENYLSNDRRYFVMGKAVLRICWLMGRLWKLVGWMAFLPAFPFDFFYRIVARNRHRFFSKEVCVIPDKSTQRRFLP